MARSQSELIAAALQEIGVLGAGQAPSTGDASFVGGRLSAIVNDLVARRLVVGLDPGAVPDQLFPDLVRIVAEHIRPTFGGQSSADTIRAAEARIRELVRLDRAAPTALARAVLDRLEAVESGSDAVDLAVVTAEIPRVLADLAARRVVVYASDAAVPPAALAHVAVIVAGRIQPKTFGAPAIAAAEEALRQAARLARATEIPLVRAVLDQLEIWGAGQAAVDAAVVADRIGPALASLSARNVMGLPDAESVPDAALPAITRYVAAFLAPKPMGEIIAQAEDELRTLQRIGRGSGRLLRVDPALRPRGVRPF